MKTKQTSLSIFQILFQRFLWIRFCLIIDGCLLHSCLYINVMNFGWTSKHYCIWSQFPVTRNSIYDFHTVIIRFQMLYKPVFWTPWKRTNILLSLSLGKLMLSHFHLPIQLSNWTKVSNVIHFKFGARDAIVYVMLIFYLMQLNYKICWAVFRSKNEIISFQSSTYGGTLLF